jgi:hypothetical protein
MVHWVERVEEWGQGLILLSGFYKAGMKMTPHSRDGIDVPRSRNGAFNPVLCDYCTAH